MVRKFPSICILFCIVGGIVLADQFHIPSWLWLAAGMVLATGGLIRLGGGDSSTAALLFGLSLLLLSAFGFAIRYVDPGPNNVMNFVQKPQRYHIFGTVTDWPDLKNDRTELKVSIDSLALNKAFHVNGAILVRITDTTTSIQRGDRVEFEAKIYPLRSSGSTASFDYRRYLNMKGVFGIVYLPTLLDVRVDRGNRYSIFPLTDKLRNWIRESLYTNLSAESAAMAAGFLIGETRDIPVEVYHRFRDSGTLHLLAVSGSNVAIVLLFFVMLLRPLSLSPKRRAAVLLTVIVLFTLLSYEEPSVVRASLMAILVIAAGLLQRRYNLNNIIAATAMIILLYDPAQLFDVGFQLSFITAWGLIIILPIAAEIFKPVQNKRWYRWLIFPLLVSVVAQLCSLGVIAFYFGRVPLISPLANLLIVPLVSLAVVGILTVLISHLILPILGAFVGSFLNLLLVVISHLVQFLGSENMPAVTSPGVPLWVALFFYGFLLMAVWSISRKTLRRALVFAVLATVNIIFAASVLGSSGPGAELKLTLFNIPGGVCAAVHPTGHHQADLIFTGIEGRNYPIESRIIGPLLDHLDIDRVGRIIVLTAAYDGLDDLLRLSSIYQSRQIIVSKQCSAALRDVSHRLDSVGLPAEITVFANQFPITNPGFCCYRPSETGLWIDIDTTEVMICHNLLPANQLLRGRRPARMLVIGQPWNVSEEMLSKLRSEGYQTLFCSKIEQRNGWQMADNPLIEVQDLSLAGTLSLKLK